MITLIIAEDHPIVRNGIKMLLDAHDTMKVLAEANNGREVLELLDKGVVPNVIMSDIQMPGMSGLELAEALSQTHPQVKLIMLSMLNNTPLVFDAFRSGAHGYLVKNVGFDEMLFAIEHVHRGHRYLCQEIAMPLLEQASQYSQNPGHKERLMQELELSQREMEILQLIGEGLTNLEIADQLFLSKRTVEGHRQNLIEKTGMKNSAALIKFAVQNGLIT